MALIDKTCCQFPKANSIRVSKWSTSQSTLPLSTFSPSPKTQKAENTKSGQRR
jgi:hypothetical protein